MLSMSRSLPSPDEIQQALLFLHEHPYRDRDSLDADNRRRLEKACNVIADAVWVPLVKVCRRHGQDEDEADDVINDQLEKFLTDKVGEVPPEYEDAIRWLYSTCVTKVKLADRRKRRRTARDEWAQEAASPAVWADEPGSEALIETPEASAATDHDPSWHTVRLPAGVSIEQLLNALEELPRSEQVLFLMLFRGIVDDRRDSLDPRAFDRKPFRMSATKVAEILGYSAGSVSVQWSRTKGRVRRSVGVLRAKELQAEGHSVSTIRMTLKQLSWPETDIDALVSEFTRISRPAPRGVQ